MVAQCRRFKDAAGVSLNSSLNAILVHPFINPLSIPGTSLLNLPRMTSLKFYPKSQDKQSFGFALGGSCWQHILGHFSPFSAGEHIHQGQQSSQAHQPLVLTVAEAQGYHQW